MLTDQEIDQFKTLLETNDLPQQLIEDYTKVKRMKDIIHAGPMTPAEMAIIAFFSLKGAIPQQQFETVEVGADSRSEGVRVKKPKGPAAPEAQSPERVEYANLLV